MLRKEKIKEGDLLLLFVSRIPLSLVYDREQEALKAIVRFMSHTHANVQFRRCIYNLLLHFCENLVINVHY